MSNNRSFSKRFIANADVSVQTESKKSGVILDSHESSEKVPVEIEVYNDNGVRLFPAPLTIDASVTYNLGDYNSARVGVSVCFPVGLPLFTKKGYSENDIQLLSDAYYKARTILDDYMAQESETVLNPESNIE